MFGEIETVHLDLVVDAKPEWDGGSTGKVITKGKRGKFFVDERVHPQTLAVVQTRASGLGIEIVTGDYQTFAFSDKVSGCLLQYPVRRGSLEARRGGAHARPLRPVRSSARACVLQKQGGELWSWGGGMQRRRRWV